MKKSFRGKEVNIHQLIENNGKTLAVGNMRVNAKGDLIGRGGKILKTREQLENEYVKNNPNAVKQRKEDIVGFNKGLATYQEKVLEKELIEQDKEVPSDPYKVTSKNNKNLSTSKKEKVKFTDIVAKDEDTDLDDLPFDDDEFEITSEPKN